MNKKTNTLIPKIRFPEFQKDGNWQLTTIGEIGKFYYGKSAPKWSLSNDAPTLCVRYGELYTKFDTIISEVISRTNIDPSNLKFSKGGEILVPRVGEVPQDFAKNCCYLPFPNIAIGEMISVYETKEYPIFYAYYFRTLIKQFAEVVEGQNVKNLYYLNLEPISLGKPSYLEQQKIAVCLSSVDEVIKANSEKLESLKKHKKGLMQNLFPQEGETVPKLRFKEFEKDGEWKKEILGNLGGFLGGGTPEKSAREHWMGNIPWISSSDIKEDNISNICITRFINNNSIKQSATKIIPKGSVLFISRVGVGKLAINNEDICTSQDFTNFIPKKVLNYFIGYYFLTNKNLLQSLTQGTSIKGFSKGDLENFKLLYPEKKEEQQKIADTLRSLDALITAQSDKIEQLEWHKKGLMQGLFPKIND